MESIMAFVQLVLVVLQEVLLAAMAIGQWVLAGEFRWYVGIIIGCAVLNTSMVHAAWREWRETLR